MRRSTKMVAALAVCIITSGVRAEVGGVTCEILWPKDPLDAGQPMVVEVVLDVDQPVYVGDGLPALMLAPPGAAPGEEFEIRPLREEGQSESGRSPIVTKQRRWRRLIWLRWGSDRHTGPALLTSGQWGVRASLNLSADEETVEAMDEAMEERGARGPGRRMEALEKEPVIKEYVSPVAKFRVNRSRARWARLVDIVRVEFQRRNSKAVLKVADGHRDFLEKAFEQREGPYSVFCGWLLSRTYLKSEKFFDHIADLALEVETANDLAAAADYVLESVPEDCVMAWDARVLKGATLAAKPGITEKRVRRAKRLISGVPDNYSRLSDLLRFRKSPGKIVAEIRRFNADAQKELKPLREAVVELVLAVAKYSLDHNDAMPETLERLIPYYLKESVLDDFRVKGCVRYFGGKKYEKMASGRRNEPILIVEASAEGRFYVAEFTGRVSSVGREEMLKIAEKFGLDIVASD